MELQLRDGRVVWVKAAGSLAAREVTTKNLLEFCGFESPGDERKNFFNSLRFIKGDPLSSTLILMQPHGPWQGGFLLSKTTTECVKVQPEEMTYAAELVDRQQPGELRLEELFARRRAEARSSVDVEALAAQRGLRVWESHRFDGYWCRETGEFYDLPDGWDILPRGDAGLTRRVRKGPHWVLLRREKIRRGEFHSIEVGTVAPADNIEQAFVELGGEEGAAERQQQKWGAHEKRETHITEKLRNAILASFPKIPPPALQEILQHARRRGAVGSAQWLYFTPADQAPDSFGRAAYLAVRAHVRHQHTNYESLLGLTGDSEQRRQARGATAGRIEAILNLWR